MKDVAIGFCNDFPLAPPREVPQPNVVSLADDGFWHTIRADEPFVWNPTIGSRLWKPRQRVYSGGAAFAIGSRPFFPSYELEVSFGGTGAGSVGFAPLIADCTSEQITRCLFGFDVGSKVTLEAFPRAGSRFVRWVGPCPASDSKGCDLRMDDHQTVVAHFEKIE